MTDPRVDPDTGGFPAEDRVRVLAIVARVVIATMVVVAVMVLADTLDGCAGPMLQVLELEERIDRLERLHVLEHKGELYREGFRRRLERETVPEPEVPL